MATPLPDEYNRVWAIAFAGALTALAEPDEAEARAAIAEARKLADEALDDFAVHSLMSEAKLVVQERERREGWAKRQAEENERIEREGRTALIGKYGSAIAGAVELFADYTVLEFRGTTMAVRVAHMDGVRALMKVAGVRLEEGGQRSRGYQLARIATRGLDVVLNDPAHAQKYVAGLLDQHRREEAEKARQRAAALQAQRDEDAHVREFGVKP